MSRFEDAPHEVELMVENVINEAFPRLGGARIKTLYDTKKRKSGGSYVLGRIQKTNDLLKHLSADDFAGEGYDYILYLDGNVFEVIDEPDKIRLIRHELQHCEVDFEATNPYKIRNHEVEDFYDEIEYNSNDPRWKERVYNIAFSVYDEEE